jgi:hypothetical protein
MCNRSGTTRGRGYRARRQVEAQGEPSPQERTLYKQEACGPNGAYPTCRTCPTCPTCRTCRRRQSRAAPEELGQAEGGQQQTRAHSTKAAGHCGRIGLCNEAVTGGPGPKGEDEDEDIRLARAASIATALEENNVWALRGIPEAVIKDAVETECDRKGSSAGAETSAVRTSKRQAGQPACSDVKVVKQPAKRATANAASSVVQQKKAKSASSKAPAGSGKSPSPHPLVAAAGCVAAAGEAAAAIAPTNDVAGMQAPKLAPAEDA